MSNDTLELALRLFSRRMPFRSFFLEPHSGDRILVAHPEAVRRYGNLFLFRAPDREQRIFHGSAVSQIIDPQPSTPQPG